MACYSDEQMAAALRKAGVGAGDAAYLVATAHPESGGCSVVQQGQPYSTTGWGIWQITPGNSEPQIGINDALLNLEKNAEAAAAKLKSQGLDAWTTIVDGLYSPYMPAAKAAVGKVYGMSQTEVNSLLSHAGSGGGGSSGKSGNSTANTNIQTTAAPETTGIDWTWTGGLIPLPIGSAVSWVSELNSIMHSMAEVGRVFGEFDYFIFWITQKGGIYRILIMLVGFLFMGMGSWLFAKGELPSLPGEQGGMPVPIPV